MILIFILGLIAGFAIFRRTTPKTFQSIHVTTIALLLLNWIAINPHDWYIRTLEEMQSDSSGIYNGVLQFPIGLTIAFASLTLLAPFLPAYGFKDLPSKHKSFVLASSFGVGVGTLFLCLVAILTLGAITFE